MKLDSKVNYGTQETTVMNLWKDVPEIRKAFDNKTASFFGARNQFCKDSEMYGNDFKTFLERTVAPKAQAPAARPIPAPATRANPEPVNDGGQSAKLIATWKSDPAIRSEFGTLAAYVQYVQTGKVDPAGQSPAKHGNRTAPGQQATEKQKKEDVEKQTLAQAEKNAMSTWKASADIRTRYAGDIDAFILDERVNALWSASTDTRKEFNGDRDSFKSYLKAKDQGRVGIYEQKGDK